MKRLLTTLLSLFILLGIGAVPAKPGIGLIGDEFYHYRPDTVTDTAHVSMRMQVAAQQRRAQQAIASSFPTTGKVRSVVILVNYADVAFTVPNPKTAYSRMLNEPGYSENYATGSAYDYFNASSFGQFQPEFDVYGPYTLSQKRSYYGGNDSYGNDQRADEMIIEACELANADGVDFSQYDANEDGQIDNVFVYYAGTNPAEGGPDDAIWPHRSIIYYTRNYFNGKRLYDYACTSEMSGRGASARQCGIGTFCHEFSHVLGLADLYHTKNSSAYTIGEWDLMCSGSYNNNGRTPPVYSAFERFYTGWLTPEQLTMPSNYMLEPVNESKKVYLIANATHNLSSANPTPNEYWLVENRQRIGWESVSGCLPGVGLLIWHITWNSGTWYNNTINNSKPLGIDICEAYNQNPTSSSASDTYPGSNGIMTFIPSLNNGTSLKEQQLTQITASGTSVRFHYGPSDGSGLNFEPEELGTLINNYIDKKSSPVPTELTIVGKKLTTNKVGVVTSSNVFSCSLDGKNWTHDTLWLTGTEDSIRQTIYVRYTGTTLCKTRTGTLTTCTQDQQLANVLPLTGLAERPMIIDTVQTLQPQDVTPYSFAAVWEEEEDAEMYYLTLCKWKDEPMDYVQDFETFLSAEKIAATGWKTNFVRTSSSCYDGKSSLYMTKAGEYVQTEQYLSPVEEISFWLNHNYRASQASAGATILVEASVNTTDWSEVERIHISSASQAKVYTFTIGTDKKYCNFRITLLETNGSGGIILDAFTAHIDKTFEFIYKDEDYPIYTPATEELISGLEPETQYSYQLVAVEEKGCEKHTSVISSPVFVKTLWGETEPSKRLTVLQTEDEISVYISSFYTENSVLYIYDTFGRTICSFTPTPNTTSCHIPASLFAHGQLYIVKYAQADSKNRPSYRRKSLYGKILRR